MTGGAFRCKRSIMMVNKIVSLRCKGRSGWAGVASVLVFLGFAAGLSFAGAQQSVDQHPIESKVSDSHGVEPITPVPAPPKSDARSALGETLFGDPRLSHGNARSCASCHNLETNGASTARLDVAPDGQSLRYNTPTVFDAALSFRQGWEGNLRTLEERADSSIQDPKLMASNWEEVLGKLRADDSLSARFFAVFGRAPDRESVLDALGAFERTLLASDSRFDQWLRGDSQALNSEELEGYRLFKSAGCVSCHQGVNIGANLFERTDVFQPLFPGQARRMRVASLRNVAVTAPYFDDGSAATLEAAVNRMAKAQLGSQLKPDELGEVVAFLKTLTGRYRGRLLTSAQ